MEKRKIIFLTLEPSSSGGGSDMYEMAGTYAFDYLTAFALKKKSISSKYVFETCEYGHDILDEDVILKTAVKNPFMVGFSCSVKNIERNMNVARQLKLARPELLIVVGGAEAIDAECMMRKHGCVDFCVSGEGEETFVELLKELTGKMRFKDIKGLSFRDGSGIVANEPRELISNLDSIPSVINKKKTSKYSGMLLYETARGCRYACTYCQWSPYSKRYFSLQRVEKDLGVILKNKNLKVIWFIDSDFDSDLERTKQILRFVKDNRSGNTRVSAFMNFDKVDDELTGLVKELFFMVPIGLQTVNRENLKALGRTWFNIDRFDTAIKTILTKLPAQMLQVDIMYGIPGDTPGKFMESLLWCISRGLVNLNFFRLSVFNGTAIKKTAVSHGLVHDPEPPYLVYSSNSYSYADIVRIERTIINFKILCCLHSPEFMKDISASEEATFILENLHECADNFEDYYECMNESNITNIKAHDLRPHYESFIRKRVSNGEVRDKLLKNIRLEDRR